MTYVDSLRSAADPFDSQRVLIHRGSFLSPRAFHDNRQESQCPQLWLFLLYFCLENPILISIFVLHPIRARGPLGLRTTVLRTKAAIVNANKHQIWSFNTREEFYFILFDAFSTEI